MHTIHTWEELGAYLNTPIAPDLKALLQTRRDQLIEYGDLSELGIFLIIEQSDSIATIENATGWPILTDRTPTFEWAQRQGSFFQVPFVTSDSGAGHVLFVPDAEGIDSVLLNLCRTYADQPSEQSAEGSEEA